MHETFFTLTRFDREFGIDRFLTDGERERRIRLGSWARGCFVCSFLAGSGEEEQARQQMIIENSAQLSHILF